MDDVDDPLSRFLDTAQKRSDLRAKPFKFVQELLRGDAADSGGIRRETNVTDGDIVPGRNRANVDLV